MKQLPDILEVARRAGLESAGKEGSETLFRCPFHDDTTPSLRINPRKQVFICPPCAAAGKPTASGGVVALANALGVCKWRCRSTPPRR